jgi:hypothetical protein
MSADMNTLIASLPDDVRENLEGLLGASEGAWLLPGGELNAYLLAMDLIELGPLSLGYVLTARGTEVAEALYEMRRAERAVGPRLQTSGA